MNIILIEDDESEITTCKSAARLLEHSMECNINIISCKSVQDVKSLWSDFAEKSWENTQYHRFDGAIIDLKLDGDRHDGPHGGNEVAKKMKALLPKTPLVIRTGTPDDLDGSLRDIKCVTRSEENADFDTLLNWFWNIQRTGLPNIMSGNGEIENKMNTIFQKVLMPHIDTWIAYLGDTSDDVTQKITQKNIESALLRYSMTHLLDHLDQDDEQYYPEEFYLLPVIEHKTRTGNILKKGDECYVIMNPACDLAVRQNGEFKASHILLAKIELLRCEATTLRKKQKELRELCTQPPNHRYCLPSTKDFAGGIVNFEILESIDKNVFMHDLDSYRLVYRIAPHFMKDMIAKFGAGYSRQGQPEIKTDALLQNYNHHHSQS